MTVAELGEVFEGVKYPLLTGAIYFLFVVLAHAAGMKVPGLFLYGGKESVTGSTCFNSHRRSGCFGHAYGGQCHNRFWNAAGNN